MQRLLYNRRAKYCSKYKLQYRGYYTIGEHNIVVDTNYNIEIIIQLYTNWYSVHQLVLCTLIVTCTLTGTLYTLVLCTLTGTLHTLVHCTLIVTCTITGTLYTSWYSVHQLVLCTLSGTLYTNWYSVHQLVLCTLAGTLYTSWYSVH